MAHPDISTSAQNLNAGGSISNVNAHNTIHNNYYTNPDRPLPSNDRPGLAEWVSKLDFSTHQSQALQNRTNGTLGWALLHPVFTAWLNGKGGMIWGSGKRAGKTTLVSFVVDHLEKLRDENEEAVTAVCYLYCRYYTTLTVLQMFEVILKQLILRCSRLDLKKIQMRKDESRPLSLDDIISILQDCSDHTSNIFMLVDAFDECFGEGTRGQVLQLLQSLPKVKTMITSRPSIENLMRGIPVLPIVATEEDLKTHFRAQASIHPELANIVSGANGKVDVASKLVEKADGMFLLAALHTADLTTQTSVSQFLAALESLPKEASATYHHTLDRIRQQNLNKQRIAFRILSWIFHAKDQVDLFELQHALATYDLDHIATEGELTHKETILSACAGLVIVNNYDRPHWCRRHHGYCHEETVIFLHYTVHEFLEEASRTSDFPTDIECAIHAIKVITFPGIQYSPPNHPLINYIPSAWLKVAKKQGNDRAVQELAVSLLLQSAPLGFLKAYVARRYSSDLFDYQYDAFDSDKVDHAALHIIGFFDLTEIYMACLNTDDPVFASTRLVRYQRSLCLWAAKRGLWKIVKELCHPRFDINFKDNKGRTPLSWAAAKGRWEVVWWLVHSKGIDINCKDKTGRTSLSRAAANGHLEVVRELLRTTNIDINHKDEKTGRTPLSWAAGNGNQMVVRELLRRKNIDLNCKDSKIGRTPLSWAAANGHDLVVRELLWSEGIDINCKDEKTGRTPLSWAAANGHADIVRRLLRSTKIEINCKDATGQIPISLAAQNAHLKVAKLLICHFHININLEDSEGRPPLRWSAQNGQWGIIKEALRQHDCVNLYQRPSHDEREDPVPTSGQPAILWAAETGQWELINEALHSHNHVILRRRPEHQDEDLAFDDPYGWPSQFSAGYEANVASSQSFEDDDSDFAFYLYSPTESRVSPHSSTEDLQSFLADDESKLELHPLTLSTEPPSKDFQYSSPPSTECYVRRCPYPEDSQSFLKDEEAGLRLDLQALAAEPVLVGHRPPSPEDLVQPLLPSLKTT